MLSRLKNAPSWLSTVHHSDILCSQYSSPPCTVSLMYTLSFLLFPSSLPSSFFSSILLSSPPSPLELRGAHLGWHGEDRPSDMAVGHGRERTLAKKKFFDNAPSRVPNCLSCPMSGIWLVNFIYSTSNLTSTGRNDLLEKVELHRDRVHEGGRLNCKKWSK